jgi:phosphopentomutase
MTVEIMSAVTGISVEALEEIRSYTKHHELTLEEMDVLGIINSDDVISGDNHRDIVDSFESKIGDIDDRLSMLIDKMEKDDPIYDELVELWRSI